MISKGKGNGAPLAEAASFAVEADKAEWVRVLWGFTRWRSDGDVADVELCHALAGDIAGDGDVHGVRVELVKARELGFDADRSLLLRDIY